MNWSSSDSSVAAREWDDWAMYEAMVESTKPPKRRRMVVKTFADDYHGTGAASSHEVPLPSMGMIQIQVFMDDIPDGGSEASTRRLPPVTWPGGALHGAHGVVLEASTLGTSSLEQQEEDGMNGAPLAGGVGVVATQPDLPDSVTDEMRTEVEKSDGRNGEHRG